MSYQKPSVTDIEAKKNEIDFEKFNYALTLETDLGEIELEFFPDIAPGHCRNMLGLAEAGFYDSLTFHRVIPGFVIQGGCPEGTGTGGPGYQIKAEFNSKPHETGTLSMARAQDPDSGGSQFFLCLDKVSSLDNQYTVFGQAKNAKSIDVIKQIGGVTTGPGDKPVEDVRMKKVTVTTQPK